MESLSSVSQIVLALWGMALMFAVFALIPIAVGWTAKRMGFGKKQTNIDVGSYILLTYFLPAALVLITLLTIVEIIRL